MKDHNGRRRISGTLAMTLCISFGALMSLLFAKTGNTGLIGVGVAMGLLIGGAVNERLG
jgi:hypothetical protein